MNKEKQETADGHAIDGDAIAGNEVLAEVSGSDLGAVTLHFKLTEKEYDRFKSLMKTDSELWDKLLLQFGCATM